MANTTESGETSVRTCVKCGSRHVIPKVRIIDRDAHNIGQPLTAVLDRNPEALVFKHSVDSPVFAVVCGDCGYVEIFVENPQRLYEAYSQTAR